jgi:hypothetical protein
MEKSEKTITLLKDSEWSIIDGEVCRVVHFTPFASISKGKIHDTGLTTPYCSLTIECKKLPSQANGYITHKIDFSNLWKAFKERGVNDEEEVLIIWTIKHYKSNIVKLFLAGMPKLWVMICHKYAFEALTDPKSRPDLSGMAYAAAVSSIVEYKPDVMQ